VKRNSVPTCWARDGHVARLVEIRIKFQFGNLKERDYVEVILK